MARTRKLPPPPPEEDAGNPIYADGLDAEDLELQAFTKRFAGTKRVTVMKYSEDKGKYVHQATIEATLATEDYIQRRWKGGTYKLNLIDEAGIVLTTRSGMEIADPIEDGTNTKRDIASPAPAMVAGTDAFSIMQREANQRHELLMEMIRQQKPAPAMDFTSILPLLTFLQKANAPTAPTNSFDAFMKGVEFGRGSDSGGDDSFSKMAATFLMPMLAKRFGGPAAEAGQEEMTEENPDTSLIENIVSMIRPAASTNMNPDMAVRLTLAAVRRDEGQLEMLSIFLDQPFAEVLRMLAAVDPQMGAEPFASWISTFYEKLKHALSTPAGEPGGDGNPPNNGNHGGASVRSAARSDRARNGN